MPPKLRRILNVFKCPFKVYSMILSGLFWAARQISVYKTPIGLKRKIIIDNQLFNNK